MFDDLAPDVTRVLQLDGEQAALRLHLQRRSYLISASVSYKVKGTVYFLVRGFLKEHQSQCTLYRIHHGFAANKNFYILKFWLKVRRVSLGLDV